MATTKAYEIGDFGVSLNVNSDGEVVSLDLDSDSITEGSTNLYYTNTRARGAISVSGNLTYDSGTGVLGFTMPTTISSLSNHDTDDLTEGSSNLYFTTARARASVSGSTGITYSSSTGAFALTSGIVTAGTYGDASNVAQVTVDTYGRVTSVSEVAIAGVDNVSYTASTGVLTVETSSGTDYSVDLGIGTSDSPTFQTVTLTGNLDMADNQSVLLGTDDDLTLYHDNSHGYIVNDTGTLFVQADTFSVQNNAGTSTRLTVNSSGTTATGTLVYSTLNDGTTNLSATVAELNRNDITTLGQVEASKVVTADANGYVNFGDNEYIRMGASNDLLIYHSGSHSLIRDVGTGNLYIEATNLRLNNGAGTSAYVQCNDGTDVKIFYNGSQKLATTSTGIDVTGNVVADGLTIDGSSQNVVLSHSTDNIIRSNSDSSRVRIFGGSSASVGNGAALTLTGISNSVGNYADLASATGGSIRFRTGTTERMRIDSGGNVGIGTTSPSEKLEVAGNISIGTSSQWIGRDNQNNSFGFNSSFGQYINSTASIELAIDSSNSDADTRFFRIIKNAEGYAGGTELFRVDEDGNVGIGTSSPDDKLQVQGTIRAYTPNANDWTFIGYNSANTATSGLWYSNDSARFLGRNSSNQLTVDLHSNGVSYLNGGNVGIGTSSPSTKLQVAGSSIIADNTAIDPDSYDNSVFAGYISDSGWGATGIGGKVGGTGKTWGLAHNGGALYLGMGDTVSANTMKTVIRFDASGTDRSIHPHGHVLPSANATYDLGSTSYAWRNVYTNDLHLSNEGHEEGNSVDGTKGNWTIQEGEDHLYIINNKNGKKFKFSLEEVE